MVEPIFLVNLSRPLIGKQVVITLEDRTPLRNLKKKMFKLKEYDET